FANIKKRLPKLELLDSLFCFFVLRGAAAKEWEQQRAIETAVRDWRLRWGEGSGAELGPECP
ncbi:hypothetical protein, partial [Alistipes finegoldii]|uniref:hypothetical protein n=1 Tax=Alistipes finegoldii TaxID=214856 RepID=UPI00242C5D5E